jgi:TolB-like protein
MKRRILLFLFAALLGGAAAAKDNLAVLPFSGGDAGEGETVAELFSFSPDLNHIFAPIPRTSIAQAIRNEQHFQAGAGMTDPDTIAAIGRQLGARYVVAGSITKLGLQNLLIISILKIDDLRQIAGDIQTYGKIEEIQTKLPGMARNIIEAIQFESAELEKLAVLPVELGGNIDIQVADTLAQLLSINLIKSGTYSVYPRTATLEQAQTEYKNQLSGATADESVVDMGRGDNPRFVLSVAARRLGSQNMFNASIINLESGVQLIGRSVNYDSLDDGIEVMESLSRELTGVSVPSTSAGLEAVRDKAAAAAETASDAKTEPVKTEPVKAKAAKGSGSGGKVFGYGVLNLALGLGSFVQKDLGGGFTLLGAYAAAGGLIAWELVLPYHDKLAGIPGAVGLGVGGAAVLYGFIRPIVYHRNHRLAEAVGRIKLTALPGERGGTALRLSYTVEF